MIPGRGVIDGICGAIHDVQTACRSAAVSTHGTFICKYTYGENSRGRDGRPIGPMLLRLLAVYPAGSRAG